MMDRVTTSNGRGPIWPEKATIPIQLPEANFTTVEAKLIILPTTRFYFLLREMGSCSEEGGWRIVAYH